MAFKVFVTSWRPIIHIMPCFLTSLSVAQQLAMLASIVWNIQSPLFHLRGSVNPTLWDKDRFYWSTSFRTPEIQLFSNPLGTGELFDVKHPFGLRIQFLPSIAWARPHAQRIGLHAIGSTANKKGNDTVDVFTFHFKPSAWDIHWRFHPAWKKGTVQ